MPKSGAPTRADYDRLKAECDRLRSEVDALKEQARQQRSDLQVQFKRIAEMQAILDEERRSHPTPSTRPLFPRGH